MATLVRVAQDDSSVIFKISEESFVAINTTTHDARAEQTLTALTAGGGWRAAARGDDARLSALAEIAEAAVSRLDPITAAASEPAKKRRVYRVPKSVREEALRALSWRAGLERGGSDTSLSIAHSLKDAQSIDIDTIARIARHAPRFSDTTRESGWTFASEGYPSAERVTWGLWGGDAGQRWSRRIVAQHRALTAAGAFEYNETCDYFGTGDDPDSTRVNELFVHYPENDEWERRIGGSWEPADAPDAPLMIELDAESAKTLADSLDTSPEAYVELSSLNPVERDLFNLAYGSLDLSLLDTLSALTADALGSGYTPEERAQNVQRQGRSSDGKFGGGGSAGAPAKKAAGISAPKARLPTAIELVPDPKARVEEYLAEVARIRGERAKENADPGVTAEPAPAEAPVADAPAESAVSPLYLAIVDEADTEAVLDVVSLVPSTDGTSDVQCWKREGSEWVEAADILASLRSISPPAVVDLKDPEVLNAVLQQVDAHDTKEKPEPIQAAAYECATDSKGAREKAAQRGIALPDGSYPIHDESDLKNAIQAYGRAKDKAAAKRHIIKRARALGKQALLPDDWKTSANSVEMGSRLTPLWGPHGELISLISAGVPGVADTPSDHAAVNRLREYWLHGEGATKIRWNTPGDWGRCRKHLSKYMGAHHAAGYCQLLHHAATGVYTGDKQNIGNGND